MKTKAEILSEKTGIDLPELEFKNEVQVVRPSEALEAMDEHAQNISQEFAEWCGSNGWVQEVQANNWKNVLDHNIPELVRYTTSDLFAKFMEERGQG